MLVKIRSTFQILIWVPSNLFFSLKNSFDSFLNTDYNKSRMSESGLKVHFSSRRNHWETPQRFFDKLNEEFHFELDVCANSENAKCEKYYSSEEDGLKQEWKGVCWMNPPYGRDPVQPLCRRKVTNLRLALNSSDMFGPRIQAAGFFLNRPRT